MARKELKVNLQTGETTVIDFTKEHEAVKDAEESAWAAGAVARAAEEIQKNRRNAYHTESDALFFEEQRGEVSEGTWAAKIDEIKLRFPK